MDIVSPILIGLLTLGFFIWRIGFAKTWSAISRFTLRFFALPLGLAGLGLIAYGLYATFIQHTVVMNTEGNLTKLQEATASLGNSDIIQWSIVTNSHLRENIYTAQGMGLIIIGVGAGAAFLMVYLLGLSEWWPDIKARLRHVGTKPLNKGYHGTRIPMSTIVKYGVPNMTYEDRRKLLEIVANAITELKIPIEVKGYGTKEIGVYLSSDFSTARDFAIMAPAYISDAIYKELKKMHIDGQGAERLVMSILDQIGEPKVVECEIPGNRVLERHPFGMRVDAILPADVKFIHQIRYTVFGDEVLGKKDDLSKVPARLLPTYVEQS